MDGFARRKQQSKEDIRRAARELFSQFGVDKVSMTDIARKAGVSQATIYNNFGSKEALVREFVMTAVEQLASRAQEILAPQEQYQEKMAAFIQFITEMMANGGPSAADNAIFTSRSDLLNDPEIKKIRFEAQEKMIVLLLDLIQQGKRQGRVKTEASEEALRIYFALFMDAFTNPELQHRFYQRPGLAQDLWALMTTGLSGDTQA